MATRRLGVGQRSNIRERRRQAKNSKYEQIRSQLNLGDFCYFGSRIVCLYHWPYTKRQIKIYGTVTFIVAWYGCETWSLSVREGHRLRVFENRVLRDISGAERDGVTGERRKLRNEKLGNLNC